MPDAEDYPQATKLCRGRRLDLNRGIPECFSRLHLGCVQLGLRHRCVLVFVGRHIRPSPCCDDEVCVEGARVCICCALQMLQKRAPCQLWFHSDRLLTDVTGDLTLLNSVWMGSEELFHL